MVDRTDEGTIAVLYVTEETTHARAGARRLPDHGPFEVVTESSVEAALALIQDARIDCVISDYDLPDTDGIAFLQTIRSQHPDLPFLLFTDEGSEEVASRAISANVTEYLIKDSYRDQWSCLASLVEDAVRYYRTRTPLTDTQRKAETILQVSPDSIAILQDGTFTYVNEAGRELFGTEDSTHLYGTRLEERLVEETAASVNDRMTAVREGHRDLDRFETRIVDANGDEHAVWTTVTRIAWRGEPALLWIGRDVTEREESRRKRALFRQLIDRAEDSVFVVDDQTAEIVEANAAACESLGYDRESLLGKTIPDVSARFGDREEYLQFIETTEGNRRSPIEDRHVRADGTTFPVEVSATTEEIEGATYRIAIARNVSDRREIEQALRESEERYRTLFESIQDPILVADTDRRIIDCNPAFEDRFGYRLEEIEGKLTRYVYGDGSDYDRLGDQLDVDAGEADLTITIEYETKSGERFPGETGVFPLRDDDGDVRGYIGLIQDVSDRRERERRLRRYEQAVENSTDMMAAIDEEYTLLFANRRYREFYDLSRDEIGDITLRECVGDEVFSEIESHLERAERGDTVDFDMKRRGPDGDLRTLEIRYYPLRDEDGSIEWGVATMRDVTESVEAEAELRTYEEIVERVDDPIMLQDLDGRYRVVNEAVAEYAGMEKRELLGCDESAFMNADAAADIDEMKRSVLEKQQPVTYEVSVELPTMGDRTFSTTRYPHYDQDGEIDGTVAICRDVTDQRDREQQLQVLDRVLRHNLHNEMNVVMGHAEQILAAPDGDHAASARHILKSGRDLVEMANKERRIVSLLSEDPTLETVDLRPVLSELVAGVNESHPESRISLECPPDVRATADRSITSAFRELIENAIVHNDGPHPHVHVEATNENGVTRVVVSDDGPGIPPDEQLVLTGDEEIQPLFHGSGLGLWLVNHVIKRSNGTLRFVADDSSGTTVELLLPAQSATHR